MDEFDKIVEGLELDLTEARFDFEVIKDHINRLLNRDKAAIKAIQLMIEIDATLAKIDIDLAKEFFQITEEFSMKLAALDFTKDLDDSNE